MPFLPHDVEISQRVVQLPGYGRLDAIDLNPLLVGMRSQAVHDIRSECSQDILQGGNVIVLLVKVHRRPDLELMPADIDNGLILAWPTDPEVPGNVIQHVTLTPGYTVRIHVRVAHASKDIIHELEKQFRIGTTPKW